jgi:hypothetical protein
MADNTTNCYVLYLKKKTEAKVIYMLKSVKSIIFKKLLFNDIHKENYKIISKSKLKNLSFIKIPEELKNSKEDQIKIILMPELDEYQITQYLNIHNDEPDNIKLYAKYLAMITYNQVSINRLKVIKYLNRLLESQSLFWEELYNCNITFNDNFIKRQFNNEKRHNFANNKSITQEMRLFTKEHNYLEDIDKFKDYESIKSGNKYWINTHSTISNNDILEIYKQIPNEYLRYNFIINMLCSRTHCHLILNNYDLLTLIQPMIEKYKSIFKYLIGYAWVTFRQEEVYTRQKIKDTDRIIFDINTVNKLPIYPFGLDDINQNPYACVLINNELMNLNENCISMNMIKDNYTKYYGLTDLETFKKRLNIFVNGNDELGILDKLNWDKMMITGSGMTACAMKYNPLFDICKISAGNEYKDEDFKLFLFHYYKNSDIDLLCTHETMKEFIDEVSNITKILKDNYGDNLILNNVHTSSVIVTDEFILNNIEKIKHKLKNNTISLSWIKYNLENAELKQYFYDTFYSTWKDEQNINILGKNPEYKDIYAYSEYLKKIDLENFKIFLMDYELDELQNKNTDYDKYYFNSSKKIIGKISESIRFQINSKNINRPWEIFKSNTKNAFSTIGRFHMDFVRAGWNGKTLLCLPSFISSMMIQLSTDYKYFASIRNPIEIINKYRSRGFGILLNNKEKIHFIYYNSDVENEKWHKMYKINLKNKASIKNIFGPKKLNDEIFKIAKYFEGVPDECFKNVEHTNFTNTKEAFSSIFTEKLEEFYSFKAINDKGYMTPLNREIIKKAYDVINNIKK